jgi:hypothetical protein
VPRYQAESFVAASPDMLAVAAGQAAAAARAEPAVRLVRTTCSREDETCFAVFDAPTQRHVEEALRRVGLVARLTEVEELG